MTKQARSAWSSLLVELLPAIVAFLVPVLLRRFTAAAAPAACGCGEGRRKAFLALLALLAYSAFIFATVFLVKTAWRFL